MKGWFLLLGLLLVAGCGGTVKPMEKIVFVPVNVTSVDMVDRSLYDSVLLQLSELKLSLEFERNYSDYLRAQRDADRIKSGTFVSFKYETNFLASTPCVSWRDYDFTACMSGCEYFLNCTPSMSNVFTCNDTLSFQKVFDWDEVRVGDVISVQIPYQPEGYRAVHVVVQKNSSSLRTAGFSNGVADNFTISRMKDIQGKLCGVEHVPNKK